MTHEIDLSQCSEVAKLEFQYFHDQQILLQSLVSMFWGKEYLENTVFPTLCVPRLSSSDFLMVSD